MCANSCMHLMFGCGPNGQLDKLQTFASLSMIIILPLATKSSADATDVSEFDSTLGPLGMF